MQLIVDTIKVTLILLFIDSMIETIGDIYMYLQYIYKLASLLFSYNSSSS